MAQGDYLDVLRRLVSADPGPVLHFGTGAAPTGLLPFGQNTAPAPGLLPFGQGGGGGGGLLNFGSSVGGPPLDYFGLVKGMATSRAASREAFAKAIAAQKPKAPPPPGHAPVGIPAEYQPLVQQAAQRHGVDPALVAAVMRQESGGSGFNPQVRSPAGAQGLMQLMPGTAAHYGVQDPFDPAQNIEGGVRYLADLQRQFGGDTTKVLAAYNAGGPAVEQHGGIPPYPETQAYVNAVLGYYREALNAPARPGTPAPAPPAPGASGVRGGSPFGGAGEGRVSFGFGRPYGSAQFSPTVPNHRGIDLVPPGGWTRQTPVVALRRGVVYARTHDQNGGDGLILDNGDGTYTAMFHLGGYAGNVRPGTPVEAGQVVGYGGGNADHLHLEVRADPDHGDPPGRLINPAAYFALGY